MTTHTQIVTRILDKLAQNTVDDVVSFTKLAWNVIDAVDLYGDMSVKEKKEVLIQLFEDIAAGKDGILGTDDDRIPPKILHGIESLIRHDVLVPLIDLICETIKVKTSIKLFECIHICFCCFRRKQNDNNLRAPLL